MFINYEDVLCTYMTYKLNQSVEEKCRFPSNVTNICGNFNFVNIEPSVHLLIFFGRMCCQPVKLVNQEIRVGCRPDNFKLG